MKKFKIYRSSAGSGKTYTLTKEFLKLALAAPGLIGGWSKRGAEVYYSSILAVTFTNDAAQEMRRRIVAALQAFSEEVYNPGQLASSYELLLGDILAELAHEYPEMASSLSRQVLLEAADRVFKHLLHNYSNLSVSTIDSFNNRVVQSFTRELDLPFHYEVSLDKDELLDMAVSRLFARAGEHKDQQLSEWLLSFAKDELDEGRSLGIDGKMREFGTYLFDEEVRNVIEELSGLRHEDFVHIAQELKDFIAQYTYTLAQIGKEAHQLIENTGLAGKLVQKDKGIEGYFKNLADAKSDALIKAPNSYVKNAIYEDKWLTASAPASVKALLEEIKPALLTLFERIEAFKESNRSDFVIASQLLPGRIYQMALMVDLAAELQQLMAERNVVHISEFGRRINRIVEAEPVPYLYERIGERYRHILIDEFQDTSRMQWHNMIPLIANGLGANFTSMVVGDAKQAIYRWRGGNAALIVNLPYIPTAPPESPVAAHAQVFPPHYQPHQLDKSFRSREAIVNFNNAFFAHLLASEGASHPELEAFYADVKQQVHRKGSGYVNVSIMEAAEGKPISAAERHQLAYRYSRHAVDTMLAKGYQLSDMVILTRTKVEGTALATRFLADKIPVVSGESLLLGMSPRVRFIVGFLRILVQPLNPPVKSELLYFLHRHLKGEGLEGRYDIDVHFAISEVSNNYSLKDFLEGYIQEKFGKRLVFRMLQYMSLYEVVEELIRVFHLNDGAEEQIYLQRFLDEVLYFSERNQGSIPEFIDHWDKFQDKLAVSVSGSGNALEIMTIHKSKGLEFKVVIMPYTDWKLTPGKGMLWLPWKNHQLAPRLNAVCLSHSEKLNDTVFATHYTHENNAAFIDAVNLLYVALTRAEDALFVGAFAKKANDKTVARLIKDFAESTSAEAVPVEELRARSFTFGELPEHMPVPVPDTNTDWPLYACISTESRDKIKMRRDSTGADKRPALQELYQSQLQGQLMHYAFQEIKTTNDVGNAIDRLIFAGYINPSQKEEMEARIKAVMTLPEIADLYTYSQGRIIFNEKELIVAKNYEEDSKTVRPDRMVIDPDAISLIDYKTGKQLRQEHITQIEAYAQYLSQMELFKAMPVRKYLVYTEIPKVVLC